MPIIGVFFITTAKHLFHYDLFRFPNLFHNAILHHFFAKVWAIIKGNLPGSRVWKQTILKASWVWLDGPQQIHPIFLRLHGKRHGIIH
jgi:hypothetical protein